MASQNDMNPPLCANGCGFFGTVENKSLCSKCYADHQKQELLAQALELLNNSVANLIPLPNSSSLDDHPSTNCLNSTGSTATTRTRCPCCNKKLGLLGFSCKCGAVFCGEHRYPEKHSCSVDFKTAGRKVLAEQNPLCKAFWINAYIYLIFFEATNQLRFSVPSMF